LAYLLDRTTGVYVQTSEPDDSVVIAQGINIHGQHVGSTGTGLGRQGFIYDLNTAERTEGQWPGVSSSSFRDINRHGQIAGWGTARLPGTGGLTTVGVVGIPSAPTVFTVPGAAQTVLQGINDAGWVSGTYRLTQTGPDIGFVAMPVSEPGSWAMFGAGLLATGWWSRRRLSAISG
jgi:hypothetical protein